MKHILVTGSSGTVGTAVCSSLLEAGYAVTGVDRRPNPYLSKLREQTLTVDLCDRGAVLERLPQDCDAILHLGANARVPHSLKDPTLARDNIEATFNLLEFARRKPDRPFIFASSKDVYGNAASTLEDSVRIDCCESPYGASKIACEALVFAYHHSYDLEFSILRLSNVYGRFSESDRVIPIFIRLTRENRDITVNGAGKILDFVHVDDVARAFQLVVEQFPRARGEAFNLASGTGVSLLELAQMVQRLLGGTNEVLVGESGRGDVVQSVSDIAKIRKVLDFHPEIDIETGIQSEIEEHS